MSHTAPGLDATPLLTGSIIYAVLTVVGLVCVALAYSRNMIESKDVSMTMIFVMTAGFSMWIVWLSCWMVRVIFNVLLSLRCFLLVSYSTIVFLVLTAYSILFFITFFLLFVIPLFISQRHNTV